MSAPPSPYVRVYDFNNFSTLYPNSQQPGLQLDGEFNAILAALASTNGRLAEIQRSDGALANRIVTLDAIHPQVLTLIGGWNPTGAWVTLKTYAAKDTVIQSGQNYVALLPHVAGVFATDLAAGKWGLISQTGILADGTGAPTANISWGNFRIINLGAGVGANDAVNKAQSEAFATAAATTAAAAAVAAIPDATTATRGLSRITTPAEVDAMTENGEAVSPLAMAKITIAARLAQFSLSR